MLMLIPISVRRKNSMAKYIKEEIRKNSITQNRSIDLFSLWSFNQSEAQKKKKKEDVEIFV